MRHDADYSHANIQLFYLVISCQLKVPESTAQKHTTQPPYPQFGVIATSALQGNKSHNAPPPDDVTASSK